MSKNTPLQAGRSAIHRRSSALAVSFVAVISPLYFYINNGFNLIKFIILVSDSYQTGL